MTEHSTPDVLVTDRAVYFDGFELPWFIAQNGISFKPGGHDDINTLTVEFFVNSATFLGIDPAAPWVLVEEPTAWETEYWSEWFWLGRVIELEGRVQNRAFDRIMKEHQ